MSTSISNLGFGVSGGVSLLHRNKPVWLGIYIIFTFLDSFGFCLFIYLFSNLIFPLPLSFKYRRDECLDLGKREHPCREENGYVW